MAELSTTVNTTRSPRVRAAPLFARCALGMMPWTVVACGAGSAGRDEAVPTASTPVSSPSLPSAPGSSPPGTGSAGAGPVAPMPGSGGHGEPFPATGGAPAAPTLPAAGGAGGTGVAPEPVVVEAYVAFSPESSGFAGTLSVALTATGATIHYTLDGTLPSAQSSVYAGPLSLSETTVVRAVSVFDGVVLGTFAHTYVALADDVAEFSSNLPIVVVDRDGDSPIDVESNDFRTGSLLTFEPDASGRARLLGPASLASRAGVRVRGESSRNFAQKSYALELWQTGSDEDVELAWLGMPAESDFALIAPSQMDRSLMRTMLPMELSRAIGSYAPRTRFVEVFLVDREGSTALGLEDYVGVYTAAEKVKRDADRVDVATLAETDLAPPEVTGGYLFRVDHGGADFNVGRYRFQWEYPDRSVFEGDARAAQRDFLMGYLEEFFTALESDGDYASYIDVPRWIDHNLLVALTKNVDGLRLSAYFHKDRNGPLVAGPIWDFDRSQGTPHDPRALRADNWAEGDGTLPLEELFWADLFARPEFEQAYWDRFDELAMGEFAVDAILSRIDTYEAELLEARERHFERWQELPPEGGPAGEVELLRQFYRERVPWLDEQRP